MYGLTSLNAFTPQAFGITAELESGETYYLKIYSPTDLNGFRQNAFTCTFNIEWDVAAITPPANDDFADAEIISTTLPAAINGSTFDSTHEMGEYYPGAGYQTVWYKFTPTVTGGYIFTFPYADMVPLGVSGEYCFCHIWDGTGVTNPNQFTNNGFMLINNVTLDTDEPEDALMVATLTSGTDYYFQFISPPDNSSGGGVFNRRAMSWEGTVDLMPPVDNDDFADAEPITGATDDIEFITAGATAEVGEQPSTYYDDEQFGPTVWFDWTCPSTGDYVFKVESTVDHADAAQPTFDLAIWQGTVLGSLTSVTRAWAGSLNTEGRPRSAATSVGFEATNGQSYKIQVTNHAYLISEAKLSWRPNTVTGDSTATALPFPSGRVDNFGNDASEPPPNFDTILADHNAYWFDNGQVGYVKWFKREITEDETLSFQGTMFDGLPQGSSTYSIGEGTAMIVYEGADYASLTVAQSVPSQGPVDVAMMVEAGGTFIDGETYYNIFVDQSDDIRRFDVEATTGETYWICLFGIYDADYAGSSPTDAQQFEVDLYGIDLPPPNDPFSSVDNRPTDSEYNLARSDYGAYNVDKHAGAFEGTTVSASAAVGEPSHGGITATRSVWYWIRLPSAAHSMSHTFRWWVESAVDCTMSIYEFDFGQNTEAGLVGYSIGEDDDSGTGNWPQIDLVEPYGNSGNDYFICVDSKTEGTFTLNWQRLSSTGTPPANDNFEDAIEFVGPFTARGTTIGATGEAHEPEADGQGVGPTDGVWYKYTAQHTGESVIKGVARSDLWDGYVFTYVYEGADLESLTLVSTNSDDEFQGEFYESDDFNDNPLYFPVVNGNDYYIRISTWSGGSEDFEIWVDTDLIEINIQPSGVDEYTGNVLDEAEIYVNISVSSVEDFHEAETEDSATVYVNITFIPTLELYGQETTDAATILVNLQFLGGECFSTHSSLAMDAEADPRWFAGADARWTGSAEERWVISDVQVEGVHC